MINRNTVDSSYSGHHLIGTNCQEQNIKWSLTLHLIIEAQSLYPDKSANQCIPISESTVHKLY